MQYSPETIPACQECISNDATDDTIKMCAKCGVGFCCHFASSIDIQYCGNCMVDVNLTEEVIVKEQIFHNSAGAETYRRRQIAKKLKLSGSDWLFANYQIGEISDEELGIAIEHHKSIATAMMLERESRRVEHLQKLRGIKVILKPRNDVDSTGAIKATKKKTPKPTVDAVREAIKVMITASGRIATDELVDQMMVLIGGNK